MSTSTHATDTATGSNRRTTVRDHALAELAETDTDGEAVKAVVLRELHRQHPAMSLGDILELNVLIAVPETDTVRECVDTVLDEAIDQHEVWQATESPSESPRADTPATEKC